jgi:hypothetical protein
VHPRGASDATNRLQNDGWAIYAASLVYEAVAGLFGVDACETSRHGQWLPSTSSEWRGKLPRPATRAKDQTKLHAPRQRRDGVPARATIMDVSSGSIGRTEVETAMVFEVQLVEV